MLQKIFTLLYITFLFFPLLFGQYKEEEIVPSPNNDAFYSIKNNEIIKTVLPDMRVTTVVNSFSLTPKGRKEPIKIKSFSLTPSEQKILIFTNAKKVWRYETKGDYYIFDVKNRTLKQIGKTLPISSLMFAKISPDETKVAYVSNNNLFYEDLATGKIVELTKNRKFGTINGTFDWVYEEEFDCRDGFSWSDDSKKIAFWQLDASQTKHFSLINYTDSIYPIITKIEYPKVGEEPSKYRIGIASIPSGKISWLSIPAQKQLGYLPRMAWKPQSDSLVLLQLNRAQNTAYYYLANSINGEVSLMFMEEDSAWVDVRDHRKDQQHMWSWIDNTILLYHSEKDGWRKMYFYDLEKKTHNAAWEGDIDMITLLFIDKEDKKIYFEASEENATEKYLYSAPFNQKVKRITQDMFKGWNEYIVLPNGHFAYHTFSNYYTEPYKHWVLTNYHIPINKKEVKFNENTQLKESIKFIHTSTSDGTSLDAWMHLPNNFDSTKKYPIVFYFYGEPAGQTVKNKFGCCRNFLYAGDFEEDGYIGVSIDNRGTPVPKGRQWRKAIYKKIGILNISDLAQGAKNIINTSPFVDADRVAVWGWSGGGSSTLNLLFQHPETFKTGIAIAPLTNLFTYDNIYEERYMGIPKDDPLPYELGSPIKYAKHLKGNLLYIHGTGDDNVHYQNAEMLFNELIKHGKVFQMMIYPNRTHSISEGEGTFIHLAKTYTQFLRTHCPPGAK